MSEDRNDINKAGNTDSDLLRNHLRSMMAEKELDKFREQLPPEFLSDASEGLNQLKDTKQLESVLHNLNKQMHHQLSHKKVYKRKRTIGDLSWSYWAILIILLLAIIGFVVIRMFLHK